MVIHDDDVGLRRFLSRLEQKALVVHRTARALTDVRFGGDFVPHLWSRRNREIAQRAVTRAIRPGLYRGELLVKPIFEQRAARGARLLEPNETQIVPPTLEQRKAHR